MKFTKKGATCEGWAKSDRHQAANIDEADFAEGWGNSVNLIANCAVQVNYKLRAMVLRYCVRLIPVSRLNVRAKYCDDE